MDAEEASRHFLAHRETWYDFLPFGDSCEMENEEVRKSLDADILDQYYDTRIRNSEVIEARSLVYVIRKTLEKNPVFLKKLAELKPVGIEVLRVEAFPNLEIVSRKKREYSVYFHVKPVDGCTIENTPENYADLEYAHFLEFSEFFFGQTWFKSQETADSPTVYFKVCYDDIPDELLCQSFYTACCRYCEFVEPLVHFFQAIMSDESKSKSRRQEWLHMRRTAMLVVYFLEHCQLLPSIMRDTEVFVPVNVTWEKLREWDDGKPFFTEEYDRKAHCLAANSMCADKSVGNLFYMMIAYFSRTWGLGRYILDNGQFAELFPSEKDCLVIDSVLLRKTDDTFFHTYVFREVLLKFKEILDKEDCPDSLIKRLTLARKEIIAESRKNKERAEKHREHFDNLIARNMASHRKQESGSSEDSYE